MIAWLAIGGPLGSFSGKLASVQENDNAAYLPRSAESTKVIDHLVQFQDKQTIPITVVATFPDRLTEADLDAIGSLGEELAAVKFVVDSVSRSDPVGGRQGRAVGVADLAGPTATT